MSCWFAAPEGVAMPFDGARRAVMVPGHGMVVAQASTRDVTNALESRQAHRFPYLTEQPYGFVSLGWMSSPSAISCRQTAT